MVPKSGALFTAKDIVPRRRTGDAPPFFPFREAEAHLDSLPEFMYPKLSRFGALLPFGQGYVLFSPVGFKGNLSLLELLYFFQGT